MADTREPSPRSRRTKQGSEIPSKKTQAEIDAAKEGAKKARKIIEEGGNVKLSEKLKIESRDPTVQQGINRDKKDNQDFDQILNPDGSYRRPSLGQLREGVDWKKRANQLLMIGAGGAAIVGQGLKSLLINPYGGI